MFKIDDFKLEKECDYKEERYSVRDNGAVLRHSPKSGRKRPTDNKWMFGKINKRTGYLEIATVPIHRIVAFAFHGTPPSNRYVVDHIDTNKHNNRVENIRWVTRLENILLNPITVKRIEVSCGCSIEEFLENPQKYKDRFQDPRYDWMCTVSAAEAKISKERLLEWAKSDKLPSGGSLGEWIFRRNIPEKEVELEPEPGISLTANAIQRNWMTPTEFPCCPIEMGDVPILEYFKNLKNGKIFTQNKFVRTTIEDFAISEDNDKLWVACSDREEVSIKPYYLTEVTYEDGNFVHNNKGSFFKEDGLQKQFTLIRGLEWSGGDVFDDFASH